MVNILQKSRLNKIMAVVLAATLILASGFTSMIAKADSNTTSVILGSGSSAVTLSEGTYTVPVSLMKATDITSASGAAQYLSGTATIVVNADGTVTSDVTFTSTMVSKLAIYSEYNTTSDKVSATTVANADTSVAEYSFTMPYTDQNGIYVQLTVSNNGGEYPNNAYIQYDFSSLASNTSTQVTLGSGSSAVTLSEGTYTVPVSLMKATDITSASGAAQYLAGTATIVVNVDGTVTSDVTFTSTMVSKLAIYSEYNTTSDKVSATTVANADTSVAAYSFTMPYTDQNGIYVQLTVSNNGGEYPNNAYIQYDFSSLASNASTQVTLGSGSSAVTLSEGSYTVPVSLMKATDITSASGAAQYLSGTATIVVNADGTVTSDVTFTSTMVSKLAIYSEYNTTSDKVSATTVANADTSIAEYSFTMPYLDQNGIYIQLTVSNNGGEYPNNAYIQYDFSSLGGSTVNDGSDNSTSDNSSSDDTSDATTEDTLSLEDGTYQVSVDLWNASSDVASMAAGALTGVANIVADNGVYTLHLFTQQLNVGTISAFLQELKVEQADGTYTSATVEATDADGNPTEFSFILSSSDKFINVLVNPHVELMGNIDIPARLKIDYTTLTSVDASQGTSEDTSNSDSSTVTDSSDTTSDTTSATESVSTSETTSAPQTGDNTQTQIYAVVMFLALGMGGATVIYTRRKNRGVQK